MDVHRLLGRERELVVVEQALRNALRGQRSVLMVTGEPGIGKTRLLQEIATRIVEAGGVIAFGRAAEVGQTPPFAPWLDVLGALETPTESAPTLGPLLEQGDRAVRQARFLEVARFLRRRAAEATLALLFDDLHAADLSSLQLLESVLPRLLGCGALVALAARDTDAAPEVAVALARMQRTAERLPLSRLELPDVATLVADAADPKRVFELSGGNPLFVEELLASHRSRGVLGLPHLSSVRAALHDRVARLPDATCAALLAASVLGREFRATVLAEVLAAGESSLVAPPHPVEDHEGVRVRHALTALAPALALGVVVSTRADRYAFSHALVAEAIGEQLSPADRARLHRLAALALRQLEPRQTSAIAHHLLAASAAGPDAAIESAIDAAREAARVCMTQLAFEDAGALLLRALDALELAARPDTRLRALLLCERARALQYAAQHMTAAQLCDEAAALVRSRLCTGAAQARDRELLAEIALVRGLEFRFGRTDPLLFALLREALDVLGAAPAALRAKLMARLAAAEQPAPNREQPVALAKEAIALARTLDARDELDVLHVATAAMIDYVEPEVLEPLLQRALALARGVDRSIAVHTRLRLCFNTLERLDRTGFDHCVRDFAAEATALGLPTWTRHIAMLEALTALLEGRFSDAERSAQSSDAILDSLGDESGKWTMDVHRLLAAWIKTDVADPEIRARCTDYTPGRPAVAAWLALQEGDRDRVRSALAELDGSVPLDPDLGAMVGAATAFAGDERDVAHAYEVLLPRQGRVVVSGLVGSSVFDFTDRVLLLLAAAARLTDAVEKHAQTALELARRLGSPVWAARITSDYADALERCELAPADRVCALRREALVTAERLGMPGLTAHCRACLDREPVPAAPSRTPQLQSRPLPTRHRAGVTLERHADLWTLAGFGESIHLRDSRGLAMIADLLREPGRAIHALELSAALRDGAAFGDLGPALDRAARARYRARMTDLITARDEAEQNADSARMSRITAELDALTAELERALGLHGRSRKIGAASERARSNVQRRIAHALMQVRAASPRLGEHLTASIRTGTYCIYAPHA